MPPQGTVRTNFRQRTPNVTCMASTVGCFCAGRALSSQPELQRLRNGSRSAADTRQSWLGYVGPKTGKYSEPSEI